ncbi:Unknown protein, partial [Striga hermonthica]
LYVHVMPFKVRLFDSCCRTAGKARPWPRCPHAAVVVRRQSVMRKWVLTPDDKKGREPRQPEEAENRAKTTHAWPKRRVRALLGTTRGERRHGANRTEAGGVRDKRAMGEDAPNSARAIGGRGKRARRKPTPRSPRRGKIRRHQRGDARAGEGGTNGERARAVRVWQRQGARCLARQGIGKPWAAREGGPREAVLWRAKDLELFGVQAKQDQDIL